MTTNGEHPAGGGAAFWAALGVRIEPEPDAETQAGAESENESEDVTESAELEPEQVKVGEVDEVVAQVVVIPAQVQVEEQVPDEVVVPAQAQASLDEVEPQDGEFVDGLIALNESLAESRRARENEPGIEPAWQLAGSMTTGASGVPAPSLEATGGGPLSKM